MMHANIKFVNYYTIIFPDLHLVTPHNSLAATSQMALTPTCQIRELELTGPWSSSFPYIFILLATSPSYIQFFPLYPNSKYYLYARNSQIGISNPNLSPIPQTHLSPCFFNISTWMSKRSLKLSKSKTKLLIFLLHLLLP